MTTCNSVLYSEIGRLPLYIIIQIIIVKYFLKLHIEKSNNCLLANIVKSFRYEYNPDVWHILSVPYTVRTIDVP